MSNKLKILLELPELEEVELVAANALQHLCRHANLEIDEVKVDQACILTTEAIINAFEHGKSEQHQVQVEFEILPEYLIIQVRDYGPGFDPSTVEKPDITKKIKSDYKRGWGLTLMQSMSDQFDIQSTREGTIIKMWLNIKKQN